MHGNKYFPLFLPYLLISSYVVLAHAMCFKHQPLHVAMDTLTWTTGMLTVTYIPLNLVLQTWRAETAFAGGLPLHAAPCAVAFAAHVHTCVYMYIHCQKSGSRSRWLPGCWFLWSAFSHQPWALHMVHIIHVLVINLGVLVLVKTSLMAKRNCMHEALPSIAWSAKWTAFSFSLLCSSKLVSAKLSLCCWSLFGCMHLMHVNRSWATVTTSLAIGAHEDMILSRVMDVSAWWVGG